MHVLPCSVAEISAAALQEMNPLVQVTVLEGATDAQDLTFVKAYQVDVSTTIIQHRHSDRVIDGCCWNLSLCGIGCAYTGN